MLFGGNLPPQACVPGDSEQRWAPFQERKLGLVYQVPSLIVLQQHTGLTFIFLNTDLTFLFLMLLLFLFHILFEW